MSRMTQTRTLAADAPLQAAGSVQRSWTCSYKLQSHVHTLVRHGVTLHDPQPGVMTSVQTLDTDLQLAMYISGTERHASRHRTAKGVFRGVALVS